ncbi:MAG: hypothetical protein ABSC19_16005 [Syntrophorhabdales bacterium]|jgi:hypothetical protein
MRHVKKGLIVVLTAVLLSGLFTLPSHAQVTNAPPSAAQGYPAQKADDKWEFTIAPYAWLVGISGDITVKNRTDHVSVPFNDILKNLDFGGEVQIEARKGRWGMFFQENYLKLTPTASLSRPAQIDILQGGPAVRGVDVRLDTQISISEFGGFYRLVECGAPSKQGSGSVDMLVGGRYWYLQNHTFLSLPQRGVGFSDTAYGDIIDPMIGFRMQAYLARNFFVNLRGDAAGFGVSSNSSHISWNYVGLLGYNISPCASLAAGYRYLYINYSPSGGAGARLTMQGPLIGFAYRF